MTNIDERAKELGEKLGQALSKEKSLTGVKIKAFENALLIEIPGAGVYALPEATVAYKFRSTPG
jgi:hypothetical protein